MIDLKIKRLFFDRRRVMDAVERARRKALAGSGALVRKIAKDSIRKRKKPSRPGEPPHSHTGLLKRFIFFGYDEFSRGVVVGPVALKRRATVPHLLEYGGLTEGRNRRRRVRIAPRPYMGPALLKAKPKLPEMWRNSIRPKV